MRPQLHNYRFSKGYSLSIINYPTEQNISLYRLDIGVHDFRISVPKTASLAKF